MSPDSLECEELEKQTLEIIELQREATLDENEHKISWKKWFKNPDFYKVTGCVKHFVVCCFNVGDR